MHSALRGWPRENNPSSYVDGVPALQRPDSIHAELYTMEKSMNNNASDTFKLSYLVLFILFMAVLGYGIFLMKERAVKKDYIKAVKDNTVVSYAHFIAKYPYSQYTTDVIYLRDKLVLDTARKENTLAAYQHFFTTCPGSSWTDVATYYRDKLALQQAEEARTLQAIVSFLQKYPDSDWTPKARNYLRHQFGYDHESEVQPEALLDEREERVE